jgi:hypothetical protein
VLRTPLRLGAAVLVLGTAWSVAQNSGDATGGPQLPVGQTFKQFEYPIYQDGKLKATLSATSATGITLNRAQTSDLKINVYDNGAITTTITSPKADLYVNDQKMRTKDTVDIERADMTATSQTCDFDLKTKKYVLRTRVKVTLKHFDVSMTPSTAPASTTLAKPSAPASSVPQPARNDAAMLDTPGAYSDTNSAPILPSNTK